MGLKYFEREELGEEEGNAISSEVAAALSGFMREDDLRSQLLMLSTSLIISNFRTKSLRGYSKEKYYDKIPEALRPFVDRDMALREGAEDQYHLSRVAYISEILNEVKEDPRKLLTLEQCLLRLFTYDIRLFNERASNEEMSNALLQFQQLEANVSDIYALLCNERYGKERYILGVDNSGKVYTKALKKTHSPLELITEYHDIHAHALTFLNFDANVLRKIVQDGDSWAKNPARFEGLFEESPGILGLDMLRVGLDNKHFHSSWPHEIIVNGKGIKRVTVIDDPPLGVYYCTRFKNDEIGMGVMAIPDDPSSVIIHDSNLAARVILDNQLSTNDTHCLFDLAGCIARDMFVCEERDKFYKEDKIEGLEKRKKDKKPILQRIIWLPRFKINLQNLSGGNVDVREQVIRLSPSHVSGHPRRVENPNPKQIEIAERLGIKLLPGQTYVQEHDRSGSREFRRQYKSRSAVDLIFGEEGGRYIERALQQSSSEDFQSSL